MIEHLPDEIRSLYVHIFEEAEGTHRVAGNKVGLINPLGGYVVEGLFTDFGFIDTQGNEIIKPQYRWAFNFSEGLALVETTENRKYFIDKEGKITIDLLGYDEVYPFSQGRACVVKNGHYGFIDKKGYLVIPCKYTYVVGRFEFRFNKSGNIIVVVDENSGIIDINGNYIHKPIYDIIRYTDGSENHSMELYKDNTKLLLDEDAKIIKEETL